MQDYGQVKESIQGECAVCHRIHSISFYSVSVCRSCHSCPECGTPAEECFQTEPYICVATKQKLTAVRCTKCQARWRTRLELDREVIHKAYAEAAPICRVCGKDVYHPHRTAWSRLGTDEPAICQDCLECPTCRTGALFDKQPDGSVQCAACLDHWTTAREFEQSCANADLR